MARDRSQFQIHKEKSISKFAMIGLEFFRISADEKEILYKGRWRKIKVDGAGQPYVEAPGVMAWMEIKTY